jgi:oxalate decarboxylase
MTRRSIPEPIRGHLGATDVGLRNLELDRQNPDLFAAPGTDHGSMPNLKFSFGTAHNRMEAGGWARDIRELPAAKTMAGVRLRLDSGVVGEIHWHKEAGWGYVLQGNVRINPAELVQGHLNLDETAMKALRRSTRTVFR